MCLLSNLLDEINKYYTGTTTCRNVVRKHTKNLETNADLSFPLKLESWSAGLQTATTTDSIINLKNPQTDPAERLEILIDASKRWPLSFDRVLLNNFNAHIFLSRTTTFEACVTEVITAGKEYGFQKKIFSEEFLIDNALTCDSETMSLTGLRATILKQVLTNIVCKLAQSQGENDEKTIKIIVDHNEANSILCGSVVNENGKKNSITSNDLYEQRALDLQLIAQHRYGLKTNSKYNSQYFLKLAQAAVLIEMLQNKPHKPIKISLNSKQTQSREPSFVFYNCARLSALFKEFNVRVLRNMYGTLPPLEEINFSLLNQPEEWEMLFGYILQFPDVVKSSVCDIEKGVVNPHNLVIFISNLSSIFSVYYRRVKILTMGSSHLQPVLHARIFLLRCVQQIFHNIFELLGIEPVVEM